MIMILLLFIFRVVNICFNFLIWVSFPFNDYFLFFYELLVIEAYKLLMVVFFFLKIIEENDAGDMSLCLVECVVV